MSRAWWGVPLYHRLLRLRHYRPGSVATFVFFEGSIVGAVLLSFAEVLDWWSVLAIPVAVAALVKFNDVVAGLPARSPAPPADRLPRAQSPRTARGVAKVPDRTMSG